MYCCAGSICWELPDSIIHNWIVSFLIGRRQICAINGVCSPVLPISRGIIQGSGVGQASTWLFKESIIGPLKSKMAKIRHLEYRHDVIFCRGRSDLDKISQTGRAERGDMVEIETRSKTPIWRTFRRIQGHVIATATCHIAGCCHQVNSMTSSRSHAPLCGVLSHGEWAWSFSLSDQDC